MTNNTTFGIKGTLYYTVDEGHTYLFDVYDPVDNPSGYWSGDDLEGMKNYVRHDLALVAGGGYTSKHIHIVKTEYVPA